MHFICQIRQLITKPVKALYYEMVTGISRKRPVSTHIYISLAIGRLNSKNHISLKNRGNIGIFGVC